MSDAISRYVAGKGYIEAIKLVYLNKLYAGREEMMFLPMHMLCGFAIELLLKSWLLSSGYDSDKVVNYGHKLKTLYNQCKKCGFPSIKHFDELLDIVTGPHQNYTYRYMKSGDTYKNTNWKLAFHVLDELQSVVDEKCGASKSMGLEPGH